MRFQYRLEKMDNNRRLEKVTLDNETLGTMLPSIQHERDVAITDLIEGSFFSPNSYDDGPYHLALSLSDNRLILDIAGDNEELLTKVAIPLKPLRMIIKDYALICESYARAVETADPRKIEAIDMGRRGLHNEGSELLKELLESKITLDFETTRRLFTLIFVLHLK